VVFLCDPRSDYITGATLSIDGGIVLPYQEMFRIRNRPKTTSSRGNLGFRGWTLTSKWIWMLDA
jgi:hypothetical protein